MRSKKGLLGRRGASSKRAAVAPRVGRRPLHKAIAAVAAASAGLGALVAGLVIARATPGGASTPTLTFAGTLRDANGAALKGKPTLAFDFKKGAVKLCTVTTTPVDDVAGDGAFRAVLDLASTCPTTLFDGSDVTLDVSVDGTVVAAGQPVGAVPYAKYADQLGSPDCPVGFDRGQAPAPLPDAIVCVARNANKQIIDEVVKVGTGPTAFWIDRYEASLWTKADPAQGAQAFVNDDSATYPPGAQIVDAAHTLYARSRSNFTPARYVTYFHAVEGCQASGKRLATGAEWLRAARGTHDPGPNSGLGNHRCNTQGQSARPTGLAIDLAYTDSCVSVWGAEDMIGNLLEITDEWFASVGGAAPDAGAWPGADFAGDGTWNVTSTAYAAGAPTPGMPAIGRRGGNFSQGTSAGVFAIDLLASPAASAASVGFRCVVTR
jgi:formylglycine-generating enzyme required for sulfatase activity